MHPAELDVLQGARGGIIAADEDGTIAFANPEAARVVGRPLAVGMPLSALMPERLRPRHHAGFARYVRTGESRLEGRTVRVPALTEAGAEVEIDLTIRIFRRPDGTKLAVAAVHRVADGEAPPDLVRIESAFLARAYDLI